MNKQFEMQGISKTEYNSIHKWLKKRLSFHVCSKCDKLGRIENALIKGMLYERNVDNFIGLCNSCHSKYDQINLGVKRSEQTKTKYSCAKSGLVGSNSLAGKKVIDIHGVIYNTMSECAKIHNLSVCSISAMLKNKQTNKLKIKLHSNEN